MEATEQLIVLTDKAVAHLKTLLAKDNSAELALRVFISPGGCSGYSYGMALDDVVQDDDRVFEQEGVRVVVDEMSATYLAGAQVDYVDRLMDGGFTVYNPNASSSCACGHSFKAGDGGAPQPCH